ncbi:hypothetical protein MHK_009757 [Candidatus Magnetomorum sp. HK-1]|nr:hypothetical protein MHK_009757 [Candidatus Magnetomorum sp. HK-1]
MKSRQLKKKLLKDLSLNDWEVRLSKYLSIPPSQLINPLITLLYNPEPIIKWRAVNRWALKQLNFLPPNEKIQTLKKDLHKVELFDQFNLRYVPISDIANTFFKYERCE